MFGNCFKKLIFWKLCFSRWFETHLLISFYFLNILFNSFLIFFKFKVTPIISIYPINKDIPRGYVKSISHAIEKHFWSLLRMNSDGHSIREAIVDFSNITGIFIHYSRKLMHGESWSAPFLETGDFPRTRVNIFYAWIKDIHVTQGLRSTMIQSGTCPEKQESCSIRIMDIQERIWITDTLLLIKNDSNH